MEDDTLSNIPTDTPEPPLVFEFGAEVEVGNAGFSFQPVTGFELEIDGSVYMYSEDGHLEVSMLGGLLANETNIAELNDTLAGEFMENFDSFKLIEAGSDQIEDITGYVNELEFVNAEENGLGRALICAPYLNQYFFLLVIASAEHWQSRGQPFFDVIKSHIHFYPLSDNATSESTQDTYPDLTLENYPDLDGDDEFTVDVEKRDVSLLLAARSQDIHAQVSLTAIQSPSGQLLYQYDPETGAFESGLCNQPLTGRDGEVCFFFPRDNTHSLQPGQYRFAFATSGEKALEEIRVIIRQGRALEMQSLDLSFWFAVDDTRFDQPETMDAFMTAIRQALQQRLSPFNFQVGEIEIRHAAPEELDAFRTINIETDLADCSYMIAETTQNTRAFQVGLVETILATDGSGEIRLPAISTGAPGMILSHNSPHACVLAAWPSFEGDPSRLADALIEQLILFSGIDTEGTQPDGAQMLTLNREVAWRLRRHPLFYDAD